MHGITTINTLLFLMSANSKIKLKSNSSSFERVGRFHHWPVRARKLRSGRKLLG
jgi:hypothetical protein